jgi:hypothetical protein
MRSTSALFSRPQYAVWCNNDPDANDLTVGFQNINVKVRALFRFINLVEEVSKLNRYMVQGQLGRHTVTVVFDA